MKTIGIALVVLLFLAGSAYIGFERGRAIGSASQARSQPTEIRAKSSDDNLVVADAKVVPVQDLKLNFSSGGTVAEVLVQEGDRVAKDAPLIRLDTSDLQLNVEQAQAALAQAQANYNKLLAGASPSEIAVAQAQLAQAKAQQLQTTGSVTPQDIAAGQAQVEQAQANLTQLQAGPKAADVQAAQAALDQAQANLVTQRDKLSAAKTQAQSQMEQAAIALQESQDNYSQIYWINRSQTMQSLSPDEQYAVQSTVLDEQAALQAEQIAEETLHQAMVAYDTARQNEVSGVAAAEAQVRNAQANLDRVRSGAEPNQITSARAQVAAARANLAKLHGEQRSGSLSAASALVESAQANLDRLTSPPRPTDLAGLQAQVQQAEVVLKQARRAFDQATLRAPIAGTVAKINVDVGERISPTSPQPAIDLADLSSWQIETTDLTELSVAKIRAGDPVTITIDALPGLALPGKVRDIQEIGENVQGDIIYNVIILPERQDERLRWNMTASVSIQTR